MNSQGNSAQVTLTLNLQHLSFKALCKQTHAFKFDRIKKFHQRQMISLKCFVSSVQQDENDLTDRAHSKFVFSEISSFLITEGFFNFFLEACLEVFSCLKYRTIIIQIGKN